MEQHALKLAAT